MFKINNYIKLLRNYKNTKKNLNKYMDKITLIIIIYKFGQI